jgi:uncharacterized membrane protein YeaQ/YmgE (transglycosylase-associated protein family)
MNAKDTSIFARISSIIGTFLFAWIAAAVIHTKLDGCLDSLVLGWIGGCVFTTFFYMMLFIVLRSDGEDQRRVKHGRRKDD